MVEHKLTPSMQKGSPAKNNRFRVHDPRRYPEPPATSVQPTADINRANMMSDSIDTTISMPLSQFQDDVLGGNFEGFEDAFPDHRIANISKRFRDACVPKLTEDKKKVLPMEKAVSDAWVAADRSEDGPLCPGFFVHLSPNKSEDKDDSRYKIDGSLIAEQDKSITIQDVPNWSLQRLSIEFKRGGTDYNPFDDRRGGQLETNALTRMKVRGQLMSYAQHVFLYQHRTAAFFLSVNGPEFRVMRWDRSGVIVSHSTNYTATPEDTKKLLQVLFAFSTLSPIQQGLDHSATRLLEDSCGWKRMDALAEDHKWDLDSSERDIPLDDESVVHFVHFPKNRTANSFFFGNAHDDPMVACGETEHLYEKDITPVFTYVRKAFKDSLVKGWPRYQLTLHGRRYLVGKPLVRASGMVGRGTRGYVALDWENQRFVFLKDAWRPYYEDLQREGAILEMLNLKKVRFVPTLVDHDDIPKEAPLLDDEDVPDPEASMKTKAKTIPRQETETSNYHPKTGEKKVESAGPQGQELRHLVHYRIIVEEVCLPSTAFQNCRQLASIILDSICAHADAYTECNKLLHRDISAGNILIFPTVERMGNMFGVVRRGLLSDWELAKCEESAVVSQPYRTGTWPFMSVRCLSDWDAPVRVADEIESFTHVFLYHTVRFVHSNLTAIEGFMHEYFDGCMMKDDQPGCPAQKLASIRNGFPTYYTEVPVEFYVALASGELSAYMQLKDMFKELFKPLRAKHILDQAEARDKLQHAAPHDSDMQTEDPNSQFALARYAAWRRGKAQLSLAPIVESPTVKPSEEQDNLKPTADDKEWAPKINDHVWIQEVLERWVYLTKWPVSDKCADRLVSYVPQPLKPSLVAKSAATGGRSRNAAVSGTHSVKNVTSTGSGKKRERDPEEPEPQPESGEGSGSAGGIASSSKTKKAKKVKQG